MCIAIGWLPQKITKKISGSSVVSSYHDVEGHHIWLGTFHEGVKVVDDRTWKPDKFCRFPFFAEHSANSRTFYHFI